jgi:hypothetical protein
VGQRGVDDYLRPHELVGIEGLDQTRARVAYEDFHVSVDDYIAGLGEFHRMGIVPDVGFGHPTLNSAHQVGQGLELSRDVPEYLDRSYGGGDGTVPLISAIPPELDDQRGFLRYTNQKHGSLQTDDRTLSAEILNRLVQSQAGTTKARNPVDVSNVFAEPALSLDCPQFVMAGTPASLVVEVARNDGTALTVDSSPSIDVIDLASGAKVVDGLEVGLGDAVPLPTDPGDYRIEVTCGDLQSRSLLAVIDA